MVELVFRGTRFFPNYFRQNTVELRGEDEFFPRIESVEDQRTEEVKEERAQDPSSDQDMRYRRFEDRDGVGPEKN